MLVFINTIISFFLIYTPALDPNDFMTCEMVRYIKWIESRYHKFKDKRHVVTKFPGNSSESIYLI